MLQIIHIINLLHSELSIFNHTQILLGILRYQSFNKKITSSSFNFFKGNASKSYAKALIKTSAR